MELDFCHYAALMMGKSKQSKSLADVIVRAQ